MKSGMRMTLDQLPQKMREQARAKLGQPLQIRTVENGVVKTNKYRARRVEVDGIKFDSRLEATQYRQLKVRERASEITGLRVHVKFALFDPGDNCRGEHIGTYCADFVFREGGKTVVADAKSEATRRRRDWPRTKKLMRMCHGHEVVELGLK